MIFANKRNLRCLLASDYDELTLMKSHNRKLNELNLHIVEESRLRIRRIRTFKALGDSTAQLLTACLGKLRKIERETVKRCARSIQGLNGRANIFCISVFGI